MTDYLTALAFNAWVIYAISAAVTVVTIPVVGIVKHYQHKEF